VEQAIGWYEELASHSLAPGVDLRLGILLGEARREDRVGRLVRTWRSRGEPLATYAEVVAAAYLGAAQVSPGLVAHTLGELGPGWFGDVIALRLPAAGPEIVEDARRRLENRTGPLLWRLRTLTLLDLVLLACGALVARRLWRRCAGGRRPIADAALPPPWTLAIGVTALVRGGALGALIGAGMLFGHTWFTEQPLLAEALDQPLVYLPILIVASYMLLRPARLGLVAAFGLRPRPTGWRPCLEATAVLVAAGILTDIGLGVLGERLGWAPHWSEWFDADLAWGRPAAVAVTVVGAVIFAPVFEELIFRGLVYGSLRARFSWPVAAVASAVVFGLAHGYGVVGFASVLVSGILWAYVYERTGSLLPGMAAHVINNAAVAVTLVALLR
jgi:membrane protease YdiL (CAAX protease family)